MGCGTCMGDSFLSGQVSGRLESTARVDDRFTLVSTRVAYAPINQQRHWDG